MLISTQARTNGLVFPNRSTSVTLSAQAPEPGVASEETFTPSSVDPKSKERYPAWTPLANAGLAAGLVGVCSLVGAAGAATIGPLATGVALPLVAGVGTTTWVWKSSRKDNFPIVASALGAGVAGMVAGFGAPLLAIPGASWGVKGALVAAGVAGGLAGVATAFGIANANKKIDAHNASLKQPG